jgi:hypothetical protein
MLLGTNDGASLGIVEPTRDGANVDGDAVATVETNAGPVDGANKDADAGDGAEEDGDADSSPEEVANSLSQTKGHSISPVTSSGIEN